MLGVPLRLFQLQLQQQQAEGASRQEAARLGAMNSKQRKDFNRVNGIALDLGAQVRARVCGIARVVKKFVGVFLRLQRSGFWGTDEAKRRLPVVRCGGCFYEGWGRTL